MPTPPDASTRLDALTGRPTLTVLRCAEHGCTNGTPVRPEHLDNLTARPWRCPGHQPRNRTRDTERSSH